jgi:hypothetical protein
MTPFFLLLFAVVTLVNPRVLKRLGVQVLIIRKREVPVKQVYPWHSTEWERVCRYARMPRETYPPIKCIKHADGFRILDGHHRLAAARRRGDDTVRIEFF